jgi:NitT/TauT family transport system substrate-binding protein
VQYVTRPTGVDGVAAVAAGEADISIGAVFGLIPRLDAGTPLVILGGIHVGCFEVFGSDRIRSMLDFKGKKVAVTRLGSARHLLTASLAAHVGLDPRKDIDWLENPAAEAMRLFANGKIDGFIAFPPEPQELRAVPGGAGGTEGRRGVPRTAVLSTRPFVSPMLSPRQLAKFTRRH